MIIVKLTNGSLWINSPVSVSDEVLAQINSIGPTGYLVAPTKLHVWRLEQGHKLFPDAELWGPPGFSGKTKEMTFTGLLKDDPPASWKEDLDQLVFKGSCILQEATFFHRKSRTVIMADFIQNQWVQPGACFQNSIKRLAGVLYPDGGVPLDVRLSFVHGKLARQSLEKLLSWDFDKLIIAHGACVESEAKAFVKNAFRWLVR